MLSGFLSLAFMGGGGGVPAGDVTGPTLVGQPVLSSNGLTLTTTYSEALDPTSVPTLTLSGTASTVASVNVTGLTVVGTLNTPAFEGEVIAVSASGAPIQDLAGNDAAGLSSQAVTNNSTVIPTFAQIAAMGGNTNVREFFARPADLNYDAGTGLVNQNNDVGGGALHLTGAGATRPAFHAADGSTVANDGSLPGLGYIKYVRANNTQLLNASLNRAQEHMVCMVVRFTALTSLSRAFASVGTNARAILYTPSGVVTMFGSAAGPALAQVVAAEWFLLICHFKGAAGAEMFAKHFMATGNDGAGTATGYQEGRDVSAGNSGGFDRYWTGICDGAFNATQRNHLRRWANALCTWDPISAPPVGGEDIRVVGDGDSKMAGNGGGSGAASYLTLLNLGSNKVRIINKATGGDRLSGGSGVDAQYAGVNGAGPNFVTVTNSDFTLKQVFVIDATTNDFANDVTAVTALASLDSLLSKAAATGFKVVILTCCRGNFTGPQETERLAYNVGVRARAGANVAIAEVADTVASPTILAGTFSDGTLWHDGFHYKGANVATVAGIVSAAILAV